MAGSSFAHLDYTDFHLFRARIESEGQLLALQSLQELSDWEVDLWRQPVMGGSVDLLVNPAWVGNLTKQLSTEGLELELLSNDIQALVDQGPVVKGTKRGGHSMDWFSTESIGKSYEGQDMRVLKVCKSIGGCGSAP